MNEKPLTYKEVTEVAKRCKKEIEETWPLWKRRLSEPDLLTTGRPSWNTIWMSLAEKIAQRSWDSKLQVGCVIVTMDNESVLAVGYNGMERGGQNQRDSDQPNESGMIHAEINALIKLNYNDSRDKKIYLTHSPCIVCARALINAGIKKVIYDKDFRDPTGLNILKDFGVEVKKYLD